MGCPHQTPSLKAQRSIQKDLRSHRWWIIPRKECLPDRRGLIHNELIETIPAWTGPSHVQAIRVHSTKRSKWKQDSTPTQNLFVPDPCGEWENKFLAMDCLNISTHTPGQAPWPEEVGQHKTNSMVILCLFVCFLCILSFLIFHLFVFTFNLLLIFFFFVFC